MRADLRIAAVCTALVVAPLVLSGCSLQADWDGSKKLASDECVLAAQLFSALPDTSSVIDSAAAGSEEEAPEPSLTRTELAEALRQYVPEDLHEVLDIYTLPEPAALGDESEERKAQIVEVLNARSLAEDALRGWAQLSCGPDIVGGAAEPPMLEHMQSFETELGGVRAIAVLGATEPDHAVALCEEARAHDAEARIEVIDLDGFPLALAEPGSACGYHPILFEGLELE